MHPLMTLILIYCQDHHFEPSTGFNCRYSFKSYLKNVLFVLYIEDSIIASQLHFIQ